MRKEEESEKLALIAGYAHELFIRSVQPFFYEKKVLAARNRKQVTLKASIAVNCMKMGPRGVLRLLTSA